MEQVILWADKVALVTVKMKLFVASLMRTCLSVRIYIVCALVFGPGNKSYCTQNGQKFYGVLAVLSAIGGLKCCILWVFWYLNTGSFTTLSVKAYYEIVRERLKKRNWVLFFWVCSWIFSLLLI